MANKNDRTKEKPSFMIKDYETLRVMTDPLRAKIYEMLIEEPLTIRQAAEKLGLATSKLYYHVNMMEQAKLIKVVETRMVANLEEKIFQSAAPCLEIDPSLLTFMKDKNLESGIQLLASILDTTREDMIRSLQARQTSLEQGAKKHPRRVIINREVRNLTEAQQKDFENRLDALIQDFTNHEAGDSKKDSQSYSLTVAFYPNFYFEETHPVHKKK